MYAGSSGDKTEKLEKSDIFYGRWRGRGGIRINTRYEIFLYKKYIYDKNIGKRSCDPPKISKKES